MTLNGPKNYFYNCILLTKVVLVALAQVTIEF